MDNTNYSLWEDVQKLPDTGGQKVRCVAKKEKRVVVATYTEQFRHRCEVRWLIAERIQRGKDGKTWLRGYLEHPSVKARRQKLEKDIREQWMLGNRGEHQRWDLS